MYKVMESSSTVGRAEEEYTIYILSTWVVVEVVAGRKLNSHLVSIHARRHTRNKTFQREASLTLSLSLMGCCPNYPQPFSSTVKPLY